ncbi:MAG: hypothetical protein JWP87_5193 [Labilithrix sp.]|nr:hypothetical protein [Labilithrix sp.]
MPKSVRVLPAAPVEQPPRADASGQLEELSGDDILESDDIDALEAAAAGFASFEVDDAETSLSGEAYSAPEPSGFEVGDLGSFDEVQVEGTPAPAPVRAAAPAMSAMTGESIQVQYKAPAPKPAAMAMTGEAIQVQYKAPVVPPAPATSPLPLEQAEPVQSVIVKEPMPERTLEIRGNDMAKVAAAAAKLDAVDAEADGAPGQTEVLVRSAMPPALQTARGSMPDAARATQARPSSIAPVALDIAALPRPTMPSNPMIPPPPRMPSYAAMAAPKRSGMGGLALGAMIFAAVAVVGTVGVGGFFASRALSEKSDSTATASSDVAPATAAGAQTGSESGNADPSAAATSPIDVSALPSAPAPGSAPRGFTGKGTATFTPPAPPAPQPAPLAVAGGIAPAAAPAPAAVGRSTTSGGALPAPGSAPSKVASAPGNAGAPLAAPPSAPAPAAAPPKPTVVATTGVVQVDPSLRAVIVDGAYRRANDGAVTVSCGSHRVKAGMKEQQTVNVPCGGSVSLF